MRDPLPSWNQQLPEPGTVMSSDEYLRTPTTNRVQELWMSVVRVADSPTAWHQDLAFEIAIGIRAFARPRGLGKVWLAPLDVILDHDRGLVVQPDVVYVSDERMDIVTDKVRGAPDLVVEVLSPLPRIGSVNERVQCFAQYGVTECWLVNQINRTIDVLINEGGRTAQHTTVSAVDAVPSRVLPGLPFRLDDLLGWPLRG